MCTNINYIHLTMENHGNGKIKKLETIKDKDEFKMTYSNNKNKDKTQNI